MELVIIALIAVEVVIVSLAVTFPAYRSPTAFRP